MAHSHVLGLTRLIPARLGAVVDAVLHAVGTQLDALLSTLWAGTDSVVEQAFVDSADSTLSDWERVYDIKNAAGSTASRRLLLAAKRRAVNGGLSVGYFEDLARGLGFTIGPAGSTDPHLRIVTNRYAPFRADVGRADIDAIWDQGAGESQWTLSVYGTNVQSNSTLHLEFARLRPAFADIEYVNE